MLVFIPTGVAAVGSASDLAAPFAAISSTSAGFAMIILSTILLQNGEFLQHHYLQQLAVVVGAQTQSDPFYATAWL